MTGIDTTAYLRRLSMAPPDRPDVQALHLLHAAHVERVPYETVDIHLGRPRSIVPRESADLIVGHRGGYCYHLNGAFSLLLEALGYDVVWHKAGVQNRALPEPPGAVVANHLALTVHGLPTDECPSGSWLVDAGLGDALHHPLPLHEGTYDQGPFRFGMRPSDVEPGGWRFDHDPTGSFAGMDFAPGPATLDDFVERHVYLSTSPESGFVRTCFLQRRDADGVDHLLGCVLGRRDAAGDVERTLESEGEWFEALADVFDLPLADVTPDERHKLWARLRTSHEAWLASSP